MEDLITQKAGGVADAKKRAEILQQEATDLLLQASDKLQLLKGTVHTHTHIPALAICTQVSIHTH